MARQTGGAREDSGKASLDEGLSLHVLFAGRCRQRRETAASVGERTYIGSLTRPTHREEKKQKKVHLLLGQQAGVRETKLKTERKTHARTRQAARHPDRRNSFYLSSRRSSRQARPAGSTITALGGGSLFFVGRKPAQAAGSGVSLFLEPESSEDKNQTGGHTPPARACTAAPAGRHSSPASFTHVFSRGEGSEVAGGRVGVEKAVPRRCQERSAGEGRARATLKAGKLSWKTCAFSWGGGGDVLKRPQIPIPTIFG